MSESSSHICPYCGASEVTGSSCPDCGGLQDLESRQATAAELGPWFKRDPERPFFLGCSMGRMAWMIRTGHVTRRSIIRGPTTEGFWMQADRVPGVAHLLGVCHSCRERVHPRQKVCAVCQAPLFVQSMIADESPIIPIGVQPSPSESDAATASINLVSRAQYRRIERLQNTIRFQIILLVLATSLLCASIFIIFFLMNRQVNEVPEASVLQSDPVEQVETDRISQERSGETGLRILKPNTAIDLEPSSMVDPEVIPRPLDSDEDSELAPALDYGGRTLAEVLEVMRDVTPAQGALLRTLSVQMDRAEDPDAAIGERIAAIDHAQELIDEFLRTETDEFFRARLTLLGNEFEKVKQEIMTGAVSPPS